MTALGELVGTTTHEFNNVLMTIINYAKLGMRHKDERHAQQGVRPHPRGGQRAERITNSVLGMARNRSADFAPTDLAPLVEETLVLLEREMQKYRVAVRREFAPAPPVRAVGNQIQQVLMNLVTNARQAMPGGGELTAADCPRLGGGICRPDGPRHRQRHPPRAACQRSSTATFPRRAAPTRAAKAARASAWRPAATSSRPITAGFAWRAPSARARHLPCRLPVWVAASDATLCEAIAPLGVPCAAQASEAQ